GVPDPSLLVDDARTRWREILPSSPLQGHTQNVFAVRDAERVTHLRFRIYPDGGVARLRVYGEVVPDWAALARRGEIDLAAAEIGALVLACSDMFFGHRHNLIMPGRALDMSDGWETKRRRGPGYDWSVIRLATRGEIRRVEVDTAHFKGNYPDTCSLEAADTGSEAIDESRIGTLQWRELLPRTKLQAHTRHFYERELKEVGAVTHVRFNIYPDGGVSRLRLYGKLSAES
ncbi:MAG TPA: allantoicase, partial [Pyrinomonadaceae bacterium]|nr:allantoicase [Pyrinomonadaceae bacterium]